MVVGPVVVPAAVQLRLIFQLSGVDWAINVVGVGNPGAVAVTQALANTLGTAIKGYFTSSGLAATFAPAVTLHRIGLRDINIANQAEYFDTGAAVAGTSTSELLPLPTALCVTLRTALAGKSYRGRVFLFGLTEGSNTATGTILTSTRTAAVAFVNGIGSALSSNGLNLAVVSRVKNVATPVNNVVSRDANWAVQRRRRSGI